VLKDCSNSANQDSAVSRYGRATHYATITLLRRLCPRLARYLLGREKDQLPYRLTAKVTAPHYCMQGTATKTNHTHHRSARDACRKDKLCTGPDCLCVSTRSVADEPSITKLPGSFSEKPRREPADKRRVQHQFSQRGGRGRRVRQDDH
jgi:hypothetical protein